MNEENYQAQEIGQRLRLLRKALGLKRHELADLAGVSNATITIWERGKISGQIKQKSMNKLIDIFQCRGLTVTPQWLLSGFGESPSFNGKNVGQSKPLLTDSEILDNQETNPQLATTLSLTEEIKIFTTIKNSVIAKVDNSFLEPFLNKGDIVGGIWHTNYYSEDKFLCILTVDGRIQVALANSGNKKGHFDITFNKISKNKINIINFNKNFNLERIAPIIRIWK